MLAINALCGRQDFLQHAMHDVQGQRIISEFGWTNWWVNTVYLVETGICRLISVRSWNFKDGGSFKASFLAKNQHGNKEKSLKKIL